MNSEELADELEHFIRLCRDRIMGVGNEQYSYGDTQRFEIMPLNELFDYAYEELADIAVYSTMLYIRLKRIDREVGRKMVSEELKKIRIDYKLYKESDCL